MAVGADLPIPKEVLDTESAGANGVVAPIPTAPLNPAPSQNMALPPTSKVSLRNRFPANILPPSWPELSSDNPYEVKPRRSKLAANDTLAVEVYQTVDW